MIAAPSPARIARLFPLLVLLPVAAALLAPSFFAAARAAIVPLLMAIMFGMGLTLAPADFARALRRAPVVALGLALQFVVMPLAAWAIARALQLDAELALGLILVGSVAGGTASNVICFLAGGDVALSITLTAVSTLASVIATPLLTALYAGADIAVPVAEMLLGIARIVLLPVAAGMLLGRLLPTGEARDGWCALGSALAIALVIAIVVALNADRLPDLGPAIVAAVVLHNALGLAAGYGLGYWASGDARMARTLAVEVGMQNSGLAVALAQQYFSAAAALPGAIFSVWHNVSGSLFAGACARADARRRRHRPAR